MILPTLGKTTVYLRKRVFIASGFFLPPEGRRFARMCGGREDSSQGTGITEGHRKALTCDKGLEYAMSDQKPIRILLACGIGASTGFMAASMRKVAKKEHLNVSVHAVSKSEIMQHTGEADVILLGPHFAAEVPTIQEQVKDYGIKVGSIKPQYYAALDGESILRQGIDLYNAQ